MIGTPPKIVNDSVDHRERGNHPLSTEKSQAARGAPVEWTFTLALSAYGLVRS
jgi:hypothetical protein